MWWVFWIARTDCGSHRVCWPFWYCMIFTLHCRGGVKIGECSCISQCHPHATASWKLHTTLCRCHFGNKWWDFGGCMSFQFWQWLEKWADQWWSQTCDHSVGDNKKWANLLPTIVHKIAPPSATVCSMPGALTFSQAMIFNVPLIADWKTIAQHCQKYVNDTLHHVNWKWH